MKPSSIKKYYPVQELKLYNVITAVIKEFRDSFSTANLTNLLKIDKNFNAMMPKAIQWLRFDFYPLHKPQFNYDNQDRISPRRVEMASAAMIHFGLDPGKLVH